MIQNHFSPPDEFTINSIIQEVGTDPFLLAAAALSPQLAVPHFSVLADLYQNKGCKQTYLYLS
jgi:hypothetical protein